MRNSLLFGAVVLLISGGIASAQISAPPVGKETQENGPSFRGDRLQSDRDSAMVPLTPQPAVPNTTGQLHEIALTRIHFPARSRGLFHVSISMRRYAMQRGIGSIGSSVERMSWSRSVRANPRNRFHDQHPLTTRFEPKREARNGHTSGGHFWTPIAPAQGVKIARRLTSTAT